MHAVLARLAFGVFALSASWAAWLAVTGGSTLQFAGLTIRSHDPTRALILAALALAAYLALTGVRTARDRWARWFDRIGDARLAAALAIGTCVLSIAYSSTAAVASDGYGYVSQADLWARGDLTIPQPWVADAPWPEADRSFSPLGYTPIRENGAHAIAPSYSPGLPMMMAAVKLIAGQEVMFWVVPAFGGLLVWITFAIGHRLGSARAGLIAAWFVATSPIVIWMMVQPMSDVPIAATWALAIYFALRRDRSSPWLSGAASSVAILIRPNLAGVIVPLVVWWWTRARFRGAAAYAAATLPGIATVAVLYQTLFGSPFRSGYGDVGQSFTWSHVLPNIKLFVFYLVDSQGAIAVAGLVALAFPVRWLWPWVSDRRAFWLIWACLAVILIQYLAYLLFPTWGWLRLYIPLWPFIMLGLAAVCVACLRSGNPLVSLLLACLVIGVGIDNLRETENHLVFDHWRRERTYVDIARTVARETPDTSVVYTLNFSGSLRYYAGRTTLNVENLVPDSLDRSVEWLRARGVAAYLLIPEWEIPELKARFGGQRLIAQLPEHLMLRHETGLSPPIELYDLSNPVSSPPRFIRAADPHTLRSAPPVAGAFEPRLGVKGSANTGR